MLIFQIWQLPPESHEEVLLLLSFLEHEVVGGILCHNPGASMEQGSIHKISQPADRTLEPSACPLHGQKGQELSTVQGQQVLAPISEHAGQGPWHQ